LAIRERINPEFGGHRTLSSSLFYAAILFS
jgi:hypothetical protein